MARKKKPLPILENITITDYAAVGKAIESSFDFALDTTKLADKEAAILKIQAQDRVGNLSTWERE